MRLRNPFVLRKTHDAALQAHAANLLRAETEHRAAVQKLDADHEQAVLQLRRRVAATLNEEITKERERCASIARNAPTSGRGQFVRDTILRGILDAPRPTWRPTEDTPTPHATTTST